MNVKQGFHDRWMRDGGTEISALYTKKQRLEKKGLSVTTGAFNVMAACHRAFTSSSHDTLSRSFLQYGGKKTHNTIVGFRVKLNVVFCTQLGYKVWCLKCEIK